MARIQYRYPKGSPPDFSAVKVRCALTGMACNRSDVVPYMEYNSEGLYWKGMMYVHKSIVPNPFKGNLRPYTLPFGDPQSLNDSSTAYIPPVFVPSGASSSNIINESDSESEIVNSEKIDWL